MKFLILFTLFFKLFVIQVFGDTISCANCLKSGQSYCLSVQNPRNTCYNATMTANQVGCNLTYNSVQDIPADIYLTSTSQIQQCLTVASCAGYESCSGCTGPAGTAVGCGYCQDSNSCILSSDLNGAPTNCNPNRWSFGNCATNCAGRLSCYQCFVQGPQPSNGSICQWCGTLNSGYGACRIITNDGTSCLESNLTSACPVYSSASTQPIGVILLFAFLTLVVSFMG